MSATSRFWISLHQLSREYLEEGLTSQERSAAIIEAFLRMPAIARRELLADFWPLAQNLDDLYVMTLAANKAAEKMRSPDEKVG